MAYGPINVGGRMVLKQGSTYNLYNDGSTRNYTTNSVANDVLTLTVNYAGTIYISLDWKSSNTGGAQCWIKKNGSIIASSAMIFDTTWRTLGTSWVNMAPGDTITFTVMSGSSNTCDIRNTAIKSDSKPIVG